MVFEEGAVPSSSAALRGEKVEDLLEHQLVITGALSHLDWGDILSSPRKLEVMSVRGDHFHPSQMYDFFVVKRTSRDGAEHHSCH